MSSYRDKPGVFVATGVGAQLNGYPALWEWPSAQPGPLNNHYFILLFNCFMECLFGHRIGLNTIQVNVIEKAAILQLVATSDGESWTSDRPVVA